MIKSAIFVANYLFVILIMLNNKNIRRIVLAALVLLGIIAVAQVNKDITTRINQQENVSVKAPEALAKRNNAELNGNKKHRQTDDTSHDENQEKANKDAKREENRPPRHNHTTQQTIQSRGVGYRIQAFSDNNMSSAKAAAQQRARTIAMKFPQYRSYISYNAPSWRLRIGDFQKQEDAQKALQRIRAVFPAFGRDMIVVRDRINVWGH